MLFALDITILIAVTLVCWRGYRGTSVWLKLVVEIIQHWLFGHGLGGQLLRFAPLIVGWLMLCHRINTAGWHATAAGGILIAMTVALEAMRRIEEQQKTERSSCNDS